tara:strand:- start:1214 stop:2242 length:1029 start_codon:yes stop_codon:yes gene_type:complete
MKNEFSDRVLEYLKLKLEKFNAKNERPAALSQLQKVYRRGSQAFDSVGKPGKTKGQWAIARVTMFLKMIQGSRVKDSYRKADQDIADAGFLIDDGVRDENFFSEENLIEASIEIRRNQLQEDPSFTSEMWATIFIDVDELGFEEYINEEAWAAEKNKGKKLNKPFRTSKGPKKFSVYVKNEKGNVVKVNFGDPNMEIKRDNPARRKSFRARHNCENPGPKTKARYWSCKMWSKKSVTNMTKAEDAEGLDEEISEEESEAKKGLWENIRDKKKRMGKKYKAAKPGDKDRPSKKAWKKAQSTDEEKDFKPHMMYDKKTGKPIKAETYKQHLELKEKGFTHEKPT